LKITLEKKDILKGFYDWFDVEKTLKDLQKEIPEKIKSKEIEILQEKEKEKSLKSELEALKLELRMEAISQGKNDKMREAILAQMCKENPEIQKLEEKISALHYQIEENQIELNYLSHQWSGLKYSTKLISGILSAVE